MKIEWLDNCNCDCDYVCSEECEERIAEEMKIAFWEYTRYGVRGEDGKTIDVRDLNKMKQD